MNNVVLILLLLSLGTVFRIPIGESLYNLKYAEVFVYFTVLMTIWKSGVTAKPVLLKKTDGKIILMWLLCFVYALSTYFWSTQGISCVPGAFSLLCGAAAYFIATQSKTDFIKSYYIGNRLLASSLAIQLFYNVYMGPNSGMVGFYAIKKQATTLMGDSNNIAIYLAFIFVYEVIARKKGWLYFAGIGLFGVFVTMSRAAFLSIAISVSLYTVILIFGKRIKKVKASIVILTMIGAVFYFLFNTVRGTELVQGVQLAIQTGSTSGRDILWDMSIAQIKKIPFGNGIITDYDPHNLVLKSFRELGLLFGLIYILLLINPLKKLLRFKVFKFSNQTIAALIAYLTVIVHAMFDVFYFTPQSVIWGALTLYFVNLHLVREVEGQSAIVQLNRNTMNNSTLSNKKLVLNVTTTEANKPTLF